ncbi:haloacid dehalogenase type II [Halalkalicoccus sp. NIPERK01]|uniref:haloacid dehalogenase type II n=1 Tax=Halalkalicoccus sp. NIPERK01 TaxID=3053469 RepID=UPI00256EBE05|nr:haloacid dehalogenase type II [Halalkalicoccus sp. NIPERK01]MDL5363827.1 haloacid dehalogenase type II [Halalkalicoccus sp. NIPERK01]
MTVSNVDALVFDVFGTVVDWRSGVIRDGERLNETKGLAVDWAAFADAWREEYQPSLARVRQGAIPWRNLDVLHRESLEQLLERFGVDGLTDEEIEHLNRVWHRLDPWPDAIPSLNRLRTDYLIASLSNGHVRLLANMAKRAGIPWDLVLSAELSGHYKPDEEAYLTAVDLLDLQPTAVMMVAAHERDLDASREAGLRTAYVHRPLEWGPERVDDAERPAESAYDIVAADLVDLADRLGSETII